MNNPTFKPLAPLQQLLYPILWLFAGSAKRDLLARRRDYTRMLAADQREDRIIERQLKREAKIYASLLIGCWTRRGAYHVPRERTDPDDRGRDGQPRRRRKRSQKVQFERIITTDSIIYFKIKVRRKTLFGRKDALPGKVDVKDLINEDALRELGYACERHVGASWDDTRYGAWVMVYRGERLDSLPNYVTFKSVLPYHPADMSTGKLILGIGENKTVHYADFATYPHWLIGGSTGSGKSNIVNHIICSILWLTDANDVKLVLVDLKGMEFVYYDTAPHLLWPVVETAEGAIETLRKLREIINERKTILRGKAKELAGYNKKYPDKALPRIVCIIDEFAELTQASGSDIASEAISLLASITNLGRAFGVHIITCTQRPAVEVIPMKIKVNMPLAIGGRVPSRHQSDVILDTDDASKLPDIKGRMAVRYGANVIQVQPPYISEDEVVEAVNVARGKAMGFIRVDGVDVVIERQGLLKHIITYLGGSLSANVLVPEICPYGISRQQLKKFVESILKDKLVNIGNGIYRAEKQRDGWRLILIDKLNQDEPVDGQPIRVDTTIKLLPAPQILMLPAPAAPEPEPEPAQEPEPEFATSIDKFIYYHCTVHPLHKVGSTELHLLYVQWATANLIMPIKHIKFSKYLKQHYGVTIEKGKSNNFYIGISAKTTTSENSDKSDNPSSPSTHTNYPNLAA